MVRLELALIARLEEVTRYMKETAVISIRAIGWTLQEEAPVGVALGSIGRVGIAQLAIIIQENWEFYGNI